MGWNQGYELFAETVVAIYDLGKLDKDTLLAIAKPYAWTDIDCGDGSDFHAADGLNVEEIVAKTWGDELPIRLVSLSDEDRGEYLDKVYDKFRSITKDEFGWN